jgi:hypothetical protein
LVTITLTNNNLNSKDLNVSINLNVGRCTFPDGRRISLKQLTQQTDFTHPLLSKPFTLNNDNLYHYEYDNVQELFEASVFVYTILLHVDNPYLCTFKINPSKNFQTYDRTDDLYFSINSNKTAVDTISIEQLNSIVCEMLRINFKFSENLVINDSFTFEDLPSSVNGDNLFTVQDYLYDILNNPGDLSRFEVRYIDPKIGFGVFSRTVINTDDIVGVYTGVKTIHHPDSLNFAFKPEQDCLSMFLDAKYYGNITRFINHAPDPDKDHEVLESSRGLIANILGSIYYFNGISIIVFIAKRDILPGQQLLVDYGSAYFKNCVPSRFKSRKRFFDYFNIFSKTRLKQIRILANHGVQKAQIYFNLRLIYIFVGICIIMGGLQLLSFK